jgi:hypothetical protein
MFAILVSFTFAVDGVLGLTHHMSELVGYRGGRYVNSQPHRKTPGLPRALANAYSSSPGFFPYISLSLYGYRLVRDLQVPSAVDRAVRVKTVHGLPRLPVHPLVKGNGMGRRRKRWTTKSGTSLLDGELDFVDVLRGGNI